MAILPPGTALPDGPVRRRPKPLASQATRGEISSPLARAPAADVRKPISISAAPTAPEVDVVRASNAPRKPKRRRDGGVAGPAQDQVTVPAQMSSVGGVSMPPAGNKPAAGNKPSPADALAGAQPAPAPPGGPSLRPLGAGVGPPTTPQTKDLAVPPPAQPGVQQPAPAPEEAAQGPKTPRGGWASQATRGPIVSPLARPPAGNQPEVSPGITAQPTPETAGAGAAPRGARRGAGAGGQPPQGEPDYASQIKALEDRIQQMLGGPQSSQFTEQDFNPLHGFGPYSSQGYPGGGGGFQGGYSPWGGGGFQGGYSPWGGGGGATGWGFQGSPWGGNGGPPQQSGNWGPWNGGSQGNPEVTPGMTVDANGRPTRAPMQLPTPPPGSGQYTMAGGPGGFPQQDMDPRFPGRPGRGLYPR